jgi:hypothetical protein
MNNIYLAIEFVVIALIVIAFCRWDLSISRAVLQQWAEREGLEILKSSHRNLFRGPYTWDSNKAQSVYYVKARDVSGKVRGCWVRFDQRSPAWVEFTWVD